jgi:hypothetical protein
MASTAYLGALAHGFRTGTRRSGGLPYGVGECLKVVGAGFGLLVGQPEQFPAHGRGQPVGVVSAQVITVRLDVRGERAQNGGRVSVDVREREHCGRFARGAGADTDGAHVG